MIATLRYGTRATSRQFVSSQSSVDISGREEGRSWTETPFLSWEQPVCVEPAHFCCTTIDIIRHPNRFLGLLDCMEEDPAV